MENELKQYKEFIEKRKLKTSFEVFKEAKKYIGLKYWMVMQDETIKEQTVEDVRWDDYQNSNKFLLKNGNGTHWYREDEIDKSYAHIFTTKANAYKKIISSCEKGINDQLEMIEYYRKQMKHYKDLYEKELGAGE